MFKTLKLNYEATLLNYVFWHCTSVDLCLLQLRKLNKILTFSHLACECLDLRVVNYHSLIYSSGALTYWTSRLITVEGFCDLVP